MNKARIFISYAREDSKEARGLYQRLKDAGYGPWMDKVDLFAGLGWQLQIERAIRSADFFVLCLSNNSVKKRGFVQREIRAALDLWQEKLEDDIYLIPVMLESLDHREVPDEIRKIHWVELYEEEGWAQLIRALEYGVEQRKITSRRSPPAEVEGKRESRTGEAARDKPPAPIPPPAQPVRPAPPQPTPEQTAPPPIVAPPIADKSPPARQPQPEPRKAPPDDAPKVVKLGGVNKAPQPPKTRPAAAAPKPKPRKTWSIAQASGLSKAKLVGLGLALPAIALLVWLLWSFEVSTNNKPPGTILPARAEVMRYSLELQGEKARSTTLDLASGKDFKLHITPRDSGYLYLLAAEEERGPLSVRRFAQPIKAGEDFDYPGDDIWLTPDPRAKQGNITVIFSTQPDPRLNFLSQAAGSKSPLTAAEEQTFQNFRNLAAPSKPQLADSLGEDPAVVVSAIKNGQPVVFEIVFQSKRGGN
jgi:hypothetical protein